MNIRKATLADVEELHKLGEKTPEFAVNADTVTFWPKSTLKNAISSDDVIIFIAEDQNEITGFIIANYSKGLRKATIENICVALEYRGKDVGKALLGELVQSLKELGCEYVATLIPPNADEALQLYSSAGFAKGNAFTWLDKPLSDNFEA